MKEKDDITQKYGFFGEPNYLVMRLDDNALKVHTVDVVGKVNGLSIMAWLRVMWW